jgi:copper(I)-binding protein
MLNRKRVVVSRIGIGLVAVCAAALTSACAAGKHAQTADETPAIDGATAQIGTMELHGFALLPPTSTTLHPVGSDVRVQVTLVNAGDALDTLTGISTSAASGWGVYRSSADATAVQQAANTQSAPAAGPSGAAGASPSSGLAAGAPTPPPVGATSIAVPAGQSVAFDTPSSTKVLMLLNLTKKLYPGTSIPIKVTFAHAGSKTITVPVQLTDNQSRLTLPSDTAGPASE